MKTRRVLFFVLLLVMITGVSVAQLGRWRRGGASADGTTARDYVDSYDMNRVWPAWTNQAGFERDVFTFVRIEYDSTYGGAGWGRGGGGWAVDLPESDLNFSYRLQQITAMKVNPNGLILRLTNPELYKYPFIYMLEVGALEFSEEEVQCLRRYLLNGGFLMVDDFWGEGEWQRFYFQIKRVFPDREPVELPLEHPVFHCVFPLDKKPQIPSVGGRGRNQPWRYGITWEREDAREVHYKGIFDDKGRMMVIICHNTDVGDGWEEESTDPDYFAQFSEKYAFPLGINIIFYALTH
ncbi:MAG TPA: DUF4159 domain-containing protein [Verrucomicrobiota bacterium]|nr:DUF4159 domain-containing protein [Verrucomicrobiota bacterium]HPU57823.1 DUF4159 domain-containing protein [Verrucomicrobiota bacterium]